MIISCGSSVITQDNIASPFIIGTIVRARFTSFITREKNEHPSINQLGFRQYVINNNNNNNNLI